MHDCYIINQGHALPGPAIQNDDIERYIGSLPGEDSIRRKILTNNGIKTRHYALNQRQEETHSVYELASEAAASCLKSPTEASLDLLTAGTTNAPYMGPGIASFIHAELFKRGLLNHQVEISSHAGICSAGAQALLHAYRSICSGESREALCIGVDVPSAILKTSAYSGPREKPSEDAALRQSEWFMSVFLRFMLSDGAGAMRLSHSCEGISPALKINWTYSRSYAHEAPLCMSLETHTGRLQQRVDTLTQFMGPLATKALDEALRHHEEKLSDYDLLLPHMSSYFFKRQVRQTIQTLSPEKDIPFWTNLRTAGNTGAASIYIMLEEYCRTHSLSNGERFLLFIPESGRFNFVMISLTVAG